MPIKPLSFKGDKKPSKKRKHASSDDHISPNTNNAKTIQSSVSEDDSWLSPSHLSDLAGPILIVFSSAFLTSSNVESSVSSTSPPKSKQYYALASDPNGSCYPSPLHNVVEEDPTTAEPDSIQQVWQVQRVAGTPLNEISLKAAHGGFLAADGASGTLSAKREARGVEEGWVIEEIPVTELLESSTDDDDTVNRPLTTTTNTSLTHDTQRRFRLRTAASTLTNPTTSLPPPLSHEPKPEPPQRDPKYLTAERPSSSTKPPTLHASTTTTGTLSTALIFRMQSRFKPSTKTVRSFSTTAAGTNSNPDKVSRRELEAAVGRPLNDDEVRRLKRARRDGTYHEQILDARVKGKHDKFA